LYLQTKPRCSVYWRGQNLGYSPRFFALPPGRHSLMLRRYRPYIRYNVTINIAQGQYLKKYLRIKEGYLIIKPSHTAKIYIDGHYYGQTPLRPIRLYAGYHKIIAKSLDPSLSRTTIRGNLYIRGGRRRTIKPRFN